MNLVARESSLKKGSNGCVICKSTPACPVCPENQVCNLSAQTCDECPTVSCIASSATLNSISTPSPSATSSSSSTVHTSNKLIGPLIGGIVAGLVVLAGVIWACVWYRRSKRRGRSPRQDFVADQYVKSVNENVFYPSTLGKGNTSISTVDKDEEQDQMTQYAISSEGLTIQQQLNYIKEQQLKLQREEVRERTMARSENSIDLRESHDDYYSIGDDDDQSNIIPIAYIPGVTSNFSTTPTTPRAMRVSESATSRNSNLSYIPIQSAMTASRAQPQLVVSHRKSSSLSSPRTPPSLQTPRVEDDNSRLSSTTYGSGFDRTIDSEIYNEIEAYMINGVPDFINMNHSPSGSRPTSGLSSRPASGPPLRPPSRPASASRRVSNFSNASTIQRNTINTDNHYNTNINNNNTLHQTQPADNVRRNISRRSSAFDYPVIFDPAEDISFVKQHRPPSDYKF